MEAWFFAGEVPKDAGKLHKIMVNATQLLNYATPFKDLLSSLFRNLEYFKIFYWSPKRVPY